MAKRYRARKKVEEPKRMENVICWIALAGLVFVLISMVIESI